MSKRILTGAGLTYTAAAGGSAISMALKGGASTQLIDVLEVLVSGMATASTVAAITLTRASTIETAATALAVPIRMRPYSPMPRHCRPLLCRSAQQPRIRRHPIP